MSADNILTFREPKSGHTYQFDFGNKTLTNWFERPGAVPIPSCLDPFSDHGRELTKMFVEDLYAEGYEKVV